MTSFEEADAHLQPLVHQLVTLGLVESPPMEASSLQVDGILDSAGHEGLVCLLGAAVDTGAVTVSSDDADRIRHAWAARLAAVVVLDCQLLAVSARLRASGLPHRVLKGVALAHLDEVDPTWRSYGDVDVLVPEAALADAWTALEADGIAPVIDPVGRRWAARHAKSLTLAAPNGAEIDLHRALAAGPFGARITTNTLFAEGSTMLVGGAPLVALGSDHRFLHAAYHAALGGIRGSRHRRDVVLGARRVGPDVVDRRRHEGWSPTVVADALSWADPVGDLVGPEWSDWLRRVSPAPDDERLLAAYRGSYATMAMAQLRATPGWLDRARFGATLLWPSRSNLAARGETRRAHLVRLARSVRDVAGRGGRG